MSEQDVRLSIVVPMFNEEDNIDALFERLFASLDEIGTSYEVLAINDGSRDATLAKLRSWIAKKPCLRIINLARNFGQHAAVTAGLSRAQGEWIITLDADLQNPPEEIEKLVGCFEDGYDLINTIRQDRQDTLFRRWASALTNMMVRRMSGIHLNDFGCMLRGYSAQVAKSIVACQEHRTFIPALGMIFAGRPTEIEVAHEARTAGVSKYPLRKLLTLQLDLIASFSDMPLRALFLLGLALAATGMGLGLLILIFRFGYGSEWANAGTLTVLGIALFMIGAQFFALGVVGEYVGRIFKQVRIRENFVIAGEEGAA